MGCPGRDTIGKKHWKLKMKTDPAGVGPYGTIMAGAYSQ